MLLTELLHVKTNIFKRQLNLEKDGHSAYTILNLDSNLIVKLYMYSSIEERKNIM